ncbi:Fumarate hydratase class I [Salmonella enterica subsp. enterica serovar Montevideo str. S5-403]|uniref:Fumarate hydratase class I n=1 Tax=Salmonella enterica subsp. enterica serovar Montevideo str. S5-403 TaxID=913242 RepID=G5Q342_SALMO|nr:Fumarate hydratase class I [Salmonella enterica subsp. enterica serovar Montevideo str. S5-403]
MTSEHVSVAEFEGQEILKVAPEALTLLARQAFHDASFMLRPAHQQQVADILRDPQASENDKYVALQFLRNSDIAAKGVLPTCQDTGTAIIVGKKGHTGTNLPAQIDLPVLTCRRRSISTASMAMNINSSVSLKAADRRIKPTSIRRQKRF